MAKPAVPNSLMITSNQQYYPFFFFLFWVLPAAVLAQSNLQVSDFNGDGHPDTLRWEYSGGSGFGGRQIELAPGNGDEPIVLNTIGSFGQMLRLIEIPGRLQVPSARGFREAMASVLVAGEEMREQPDPSLRWLLSAFRGAPRRVSGRQFIWVQPSSLQWEPLPVILPEAYALQLEAPVFAEVGSQMANHPVEGNDEASGWLIYYGHNHTLDRFEPRLADKAFGLRLLATRHGAWVETGERYAWIFVADGQLFPAAQKLRWTSLHEARLLSEELVLLHTYAPIAGEHRIYVFDLNTARIGLLLMADGHSYPCSIRQLDGRLQVDAGGASFSWTLAGLLSELRE